MPQKRKLQANIISEQKCKNPEQNIASKFNNTIKGSYIKVKWDLFQVCKDGSTSTNQSM